jgi:uncharacterized protein (TIGR02599 family)
MRLFLRRNQRRNNRSGFTLVEVMATLVIVLVVLVALAQFMTGVDAAWKTAASDPFAEAQEVFDTIARHLAAATLAPYQDYADTTEAFRTSAAFVPDHIARRSDLAFVCGPGLVAGGRTTIGDAVFFLEPAGYTQTDAHAGLGHLLNAMGYFVEFGDDDTTPTFIAPFSHSYRWRLKQITQPAEALQIYANTTSPPWIQSLTQTGAPVTVLAENIVALVVLPERAASDTGTALAPTFSYDSRDTTNRLTLHQLPPRLRLALVAIDPTSATRLAALNGSTPPPLVAATLFQQAAQLDADLAALDGSLTAQKIGHRVLQREISLSSAEWSNLPLP